MARRLIAVKSGIIALLDRDDRHHQAAVEAVKNQKVYVPVTVLPEADYPLSNQNLFDLKKNSKQ